jgi:hypothetical protein
MLAADGLPLSHTPAHYPLSIPQDGVLVDDPGHPKDLTVQIRTAFDVLFGGYANVWWTDIVQLIEPDTHDLRTWLADKFFSDHLKRHSKSRRRAPLLWQLDIVGPRLEHEDRGLAALIQSAGPSPSATERKAIAAKQSLVSELRTMLDEVKRVAPIWNPDGDDGIIINFAPLWRLVPYQKDWQRELKATWDVLCAGEYDWAHLAMHLWPERVVPKCKTDRSLALVHGLEEVFWVQGANGKWKPRSTPIRSEEELILERSSPAVKSALKILLEAPNGAPAARRRRTDTEGAAML